MKKGHRIVTFLLAFGFFWLGRGSSSFIAAESSNHNSSIQEKDIPPIIETIEEQGLFGNLENSRLPLIKESQSGQVWTAWADWRDGGSLVRIARLDNEGRLVPVLMDLPAGSNFSPDLAFDPEDSPWAAWGNFTDREYSVYVQDITSRKRWRLFPAESAALTGPKIVFDAAGYIRVFWNETQEKSWRIVSQMFDGAVWSPQTAVLQATPSPTVNPDFIEDGNGSIWMAWSGYDGRDYEIYMACLRESGWSPPVRLTDNEENDLFPSLGIGPDERPVISWERSSAAGNQVFAATYRENEPLREAPVSPSYRESVSSRTVTLSGDVSIVWKSADGLKTSDWALPSGVPEEEGDDSPPEYPRIFNLERDENAYVGFGDSITYGYIDRLPTPDLGYPPRLDTILDQNFGPTEMINEGLGGEKTTEGVIRIEAVLEAHAARYILIMEGTNDVINFDISMDTSAFNIKEMARKSLEAGVFPTIATIVPRRDWLWSNPQVRARQIYLNEQIRLIPAEILVSFVDIDQIFLHYPVEDGGLLSLLSNDFKHPSEKGYQFMAETWFDEIHHYPFSPVDIALKRTTPRGEERDDEETAAFRVRRIPRPAANRKTGNLLHWKVNPKIFDPARIKGYKIYRSTQGEPGDGFHLFALVSNVTRFIDRDIEMFKQYVYLISTVRDDDVEGPSSALIDQ